MKVCSSDCLLFNGGSSKKIKKGSHLFFEGDLIYDIFLLQKGVIKLYKNTINGNERVVDIKTNGDYIGIVNLATKSDVYNINAVALSDITIKPINKELVLDELDKNVCINKKCLENAINRIKVNDILNIEDDIDLKIKMVLKYLYLRLGTIENNSRVLHLKITKSDIANMLGIRRETFSRRLSLMNDEGIIDLRGSKKIILKNI